MQNFENYSISLDKDTGILHVASRFRYVTVEELALLRQQSTAPDEKTIVSTQSQSTIDDKGNTELGSTLPPVIARLPFKRQVCTGVTSPCNDNRVKNVSVIARKPFQEKGSRLTIDPFATPQQDLVASAPQTGASASEDWDETISTPASSATSLQFSSHPDSPVSSDNRGDTCTGASFPPAGTALDVCLLQVTQSAVKYMPFFDVDTANRSTCCEALDLVTKSCDSFLDEPLDYLDLAPSKIKEDAYAIDKKFASASQGSPNVVIALDENSGELYLQAVPSNILSQSSSAMLEVDAIFSDDDDDFDFQPTTPLAKLPTTVPINTGTMLVSCTPSTNLGLRQPLPENTITVLDEINRFYCEIWRNRQMERGVSQPNFNQATYEQSIQDEAVAKFESYQSTIPRDTLMLVELFLRAFLQRWCAGPPGGLLKPDGQCRESGEGWVPGIEEPVVSRIAVRIIEWQQIIAASQQTRSVKLRPNVTLAAEKELLSSFKWFHQALGGDSQYREHRHAAVEKLANNESEQGERPVHHYNFYSLPVYERSYTPPEVSFWAAATTYDKELMERLRVPTKDGVMPSRPFPPVHVARVVAAQAFWWVDPTVYTGNDIRVLWQNKGSALRNAATSDVETIYQHAGTWTQDRFDEDDMIPKIAPDGMYYEHAGNGNYVHHQLPHLVDDSRLEHQMMTLNFHKLPKLHSHLHQTQYGSCERPSFLRYELGAELAKKAAKFDESLERKPLPQKVNNMEAIGEEDSVTSNDLDLEGKDDLTISIADVQDSVNLGQLSLEFVASAAGLGDAASSDEVSFVDNELELAGEAAADVQPILNIDQDLQSPACNNLLTPLEDGRYVSPSKMMPSHMDLVCTPVQSPSKSEDLGSWDINESGEFETPGRLENGQGLQFDGEIVEEQFTDLPAESMGASWKDVFANEAGQGSVNFAESRVGSVVSLPLTANSYGNSTSLSRNEHLPTSDDPDVEGHIRLFGASMARLRSRKLLSRPLFDDNDAGQASETEDYKESFDGENGITDHSSVWAERPDPIAHPKAGLLAQYSEIAKSKPTKTLVSQDSIKAAYLTRFAEKGPDVNSCLPSRSSQEKTRLETLAKYSDSPDCVLAGKCERALTVVMDCSSTALGVYSLDFNEPSIHEVLAIPSLDTNSPGASHPAIIGVSTNDPLPNSPIESSVAESSHQSRQLAQELSAIQEESEPDMSPIRSRKRPTTAVPCVSSNQLSLQSKCVSGTNPQVTDEDFHEALLEKLAQEEAKRFDMTATYDVSPIDQEQISQTSDEQSTLTSPDDANHIPLDQYPITTPNSSADEEDMVPASSKETTNTAMKCLQLPGELTIDEASPQWMPLVHWCKYTSIAISSMPKTDTLTTPSPCTHEKAIARQTTRGTTQSGPRFVAIALGVGSFAIELTSWVFWRCMW